MCCGSFWEASMGILKSTRVGGFDSAIVSFYTACSFSFCLCIGIHLDVHVCVHVYTRITYLAFIIYFWILK